MLYIFMLILLIILADNYSSKDLLVFLLFIPVISVFWFSFTLCC